MSTANFFFFNFISACKTGYLGFIVGMSTFKNMYKKYIVETNELKYLLTLKFSQDHLETLFSVIRSRGGFNNNSNCGQFKTAFKILLMRNELQSSLNCNCQKIHESITLKPSIVQEELIKFLSYKLKTRMKMKLMWLIFLLIAPNNFPNMPMMSLFT